MTATFWVTSDCNLSCKYCYEGDSKLKLNMSKDTVDKSIEFIFNYFKDICEDELVIPIHGGEPFLAFDTIKYIVHRMKKECEKREINVYFATTTNATILTDEMVEFIVKEIPNISVSIDGDKNTHDKMRPFKNGNETHKIVLENTNKLFDYLPNMRIRITFDSTTVNNLFNDIKFLIDEGFKYIVPAQDFYDKNWDKDKLDILENEMRKIKEYIKEKEDISISIIDKSLYKFKGKCDGGRSSINIYPNGELYPCTLVVGNEEFCIGDIYKGIDVEKRDAILSHSNISNPECEGCDLYHFCTGPRCKIINKLITNSYYNSSPIECEIENIKYKINLLESGIN